MAWSLYITSMLIPASAIRRVDLTQLARHLLLQSLHEHLALGQHGDADAFEDVTCWGVVGEEEVRDSAAIGDEHATAFDAHAGLAERLAHLGQSTRTIVQRYR